MKTMEGDQKRLAEIEAHFAKEKEMVENEVKTMRVIDHPNCIKLYDVFETRQHYFMVLERVKVTSTRGDDCIFV